MKYWSKSWQLIDGCTPVSADNGKFNGEIKIREDRLYLPFKTKKPTVFSVWNDLFHNRICFNFIKSVFLSMLSNPRHTFLILTKRPEKMLEFAKSFCNFSRMERWSHIYFGTSIENQQTADERIPHLLQIPGKKFLSIEPMLGKIDLTKWHYHNPVDSLEVSLPFDQVICGGETGHNARPCHPDWVRSIRDQCEAAGVPFFFKGWGEWAEVVSDGVRVGDICMSVDGFIDTADKHYTCFANESEGVHMRRVGHKAAGRLLDGVEHNDLAWRASGRIVKKGD